jgi:signal transduction histidine kinase
VYNHIYSITQNREGTIWLGTDKGIFYFNPEKQRFFTVNVAASKDNNAESDAVSGFLETQSGEIWVSSLNQGLRVYDQQLRLQRTYKQGTISNRQEIRCAVEDRHHQVWAGGNGQLLLFKNAGAPAITVHPSILTGQTVVKAALDKEGIIWWGTHTGLIVRHHPATGEFTSIPLKDQLGERELGQIKRILVSSDGTIWVATSLAGVLQVQATSGKILAHYTTATRPQGLLSNATGEMIWLNDATLAISTDQGLHYLDLKTRKITVLTTANGLPANALLNLVKASDKYLFVTTQFSLSRWNTQSKTATNYGARDGLLNESYAFNTGYRLRDGRILLGTLQGFYYFHPDSLMQSPPPKVLITGFRIFDKNIPLPATALQKKGIHLAYQQNFFTIEFASLNYYDDDKITYKYQLEGVDPDWRKAGRNRFASYTNLDGGTYRFKVMARLEDGTTNQQVTTLNLTIAKPFWKTWWFWAIVVIILAGLGYIGYKLRIQRLLALQQVRSRIARDLHDDMGSTLSTITIFSDLAKQQVLANPTVAEGYLQKISRYSHQMMSAMDDIVWSINPNNDSLQNLISRMREVATEVLEAKNIPFRIQTDPALNAVRLPLESRYDCFMIFKEALNNIAKYAHCSQVYIKVAIPDHTLHLEITDNGQGFDLQTANTGNGLLNMQKRAQTIKGHLQIKSEVGQGTTILLMAPLSKLSFKQVKV